MFSVFGVFQFFVFLSFVAASFCLFGIRKIERIYIAILLKVFQYAANIIKEETDTALHAKKSKEKDDPDEEDDSLDHHVIQRDIELSEEGVIFSGDFQPSKDSFNHLADPVYFLKGGIESIIDDGVTKRFSGEHLEVWNLLSRNKFYTHKNIKVTALTILGTFIRYGILFPFRILIFISSLSILVGMSFVMGFIPNIKLRRLINRYTLLVSFRLFIRSFSGVIDFHNSQHKAKPDGICVANHTSPIDVVILGCDNVYAMVGQLQGGFMGMIQRVFSRAESHIWFNRTETRDRMAVAQRMRAHVENPDTLPILIFPEGTCINNTSVMMFKKGSFEVGGTIYPVAIKYDSRFADFFWNSDKYSLLRYLMMMMTSWAIKADVWYLPPEHQRPDENSIEFTNRVRRSIAVQGGLVEINWDGMLKRSRPKETLKHVQQKSYSRLINQE